MSIGKSPKKRTQHCTFCKNHGLVEPKKGHHCSYSNCSCTLCVLTQKAQVCMRHQQRVWRHQKQKLKNQTMDIDGCGIGTENRVIKSQACDKCRNHNIIRMKRNHQCPYQNCGCEYCSLTFKRREVMKHQQRVRRSRLTSQKDSFEITKVPEKESHDDGEFAYQKQVEGCSSFRNSTSGSIMMKDIPERRSRELGNYSEDDIAAIPFSKLLLRSSSIKEEFPQGTSSRFPVHREENLSFPFRGSGALSPPPLIEISPGCSEDKIDDSLEGQRDYIQRRDSSSDSGDEDYIFPYSSFHKSMAHKLLLSPAYANIQKESALSLFKSLTFPANSMQDVDQPQSSSMGAFGFSLANGNQKQDLGLTNTNNYLSSALFGSPFGSFSHSANLLLQHQHHQQQELVRHLSSNMSAPTLHSSSSSNYQTNPLNPMLLPLPLGLYQTPNKTFDGIF